MERGRISDCIPRLAITSTFLLYPECLKHSICGVCIETGLEFGEQLAKDRRDVFHAGHWQEDSFGSGVEGYLERFCKILHGHDIAAKAHAAEEDQLWLERLAENRRTFDGDDTDLSFVSTLNRKTSKGRICGKRLRSGSKATTLAAIANGFCVAILRQSPT